jgi:hypothetical protein
MSRIAKFVDSTGDASGEIFMPRLFAVLPSLPVAGSECRSEPHARCAGAARVSLACSQSLMLDSASAFTATAGSDWTAFAVSASLRSV